MKSTEPVANRILWGKALINSLLIQIMGMLLFLVPGFALALKMGFEFGPKLRNSAEISRRISVAVSEMYQTSAVLMILYVVLMSLLIFFYSLRLARETGEKRIINGLLISSVPVIVSFLSVLAAGFEPLTMVEGLSYIAAGAIGGRLSRQRLEY